jgi:hypothetical protein
MLGPHGVVRLEVARHVGEVDGYVDEVFPARTTVLQHRADVGEHRARLRFDVVPADTAVGEVFVAGDRVRGGVAGTDAGEEQQVADAACVRIHADGGGRGLGLDADVGGRGAHALALECRRPASAAS